MNFRKASMSVASEPFRNQANTQEAHPVPTGYSFNPAIDAATNEIEILAAKRTEALRSLAYVSRELQVVLAAARNISRPVPAHWVCCAGEEICPGTLLPEGPENLRCNRCRRLAKPRDQVMRKFLPTDKLSKEQETTILQTKKACEDLKADLDRIEEQVRAAREKFQRKQHGWI
jgi:hypothetical protein